MKTPSRSKPQPRMSRQLMIELDPVRARAVNPAEHGIVRSVLAALLMQAAGVQVEERDDDGR